MREYDAVTVERRGAVAVVTMNRPDALNAFNGALRRDILLAAREVNGDESIRVVVLAGAGRGFGAGADLTDLPGTGRVAICNTSGPPGSDISITFIWAGSIMSSSYSPSPQ